MTNDFIKAIEAEGIKPPAVIIADGEIHRFDSDNSGKSNGSYLFHLDEPQSGWFKCWRTGKENTWSRGYVQTDPEKRKQFQKLNEQRTQERKEKLQELNKQAAIKASTEYQDAKPANPEHPYLKRKQINPHGIRQDLKNGNLIVPIYIKGGGIINRQTISKDGDKYFLKEAKVSGGYFDIGESRIKIVICEGFATGASIYEATGYRVRCAFNCGNLNDVASITREEYPNAQIIIAADDDHNTKGNPGLTKANEAANSISASFVFPDFGEAPPEKVTDFNDLYLLKDLEAVRKSFEEIPETVVHDEICTEQHIQTNDDAKDLNLWPDPEEITAELLKVEALEDELIPEPFQAWIKDISNRMQCPVDYPSAAAIVLCSILVGTRCSIRPKSKDSWQVVPNLWGAIVGNPSTLKTPSIQEATKMLSKLENKAFEKFDEEQIQYQRDLRTWEMKKKIIEDELKNAYKSKKSDSMEAKEVESRLNEHEDNPPKESILKRYSTSDSTVPKLQELMSFNPQGVFVFRDELHGFLMSLEQEGREADRAFHLEGWDGQGSFTSDRIGRGTVRSDLVCESVFGSIQPARIIPHIRQTLSGSANDGLVQRFQVLVYPDVDKWSYIDKTPDQEAQNRAYRLIQKLNDMDFVNDARAVLEDGNKIPYMRFSEDAQELFKVWITDLESRLRNNEETPTVQEHLGKYRSLMPSLALVFHLLDVADGKALGNVSLRSTQLAAAWCDYLESHAKRIYHMAGDITLRAAGNLTEKIKQGKLDDGFTARHIRQKNWSMLTDMDVIKGALLELVEASWLRREDLSPLNGGKTKTIYWINKKINNSPTPES